MKSNPKRNSKTSPINQAFRYLSRRDHSVYEIRSKLAAKEYSFDEIDSAIERLLSLDYLDDKKYCRQFAAYRVRRMKLGPLRLKGDLFRKGFEGGLVADVVSEIFGEGDILVAMEAGKKKIFSFKDGTSLGAMKKKTYDYLMRRGFSPDTSRRVAMDEFDDLLSEIESFQS